MTPARARALLGLANDADAPAVRRAYADRLRAMDPDADPAGFAALRDARDTLLAAARNRAHDPLPDPCAEAEPAPTGAWTYAAPRIERATPGLAAHVPEPADAPFYAGKGGAAQEPATTPLAIAPWPFAIPRLVDRAPDAGEILADRGRWAALDSLLTAGDPGIVLTDAEVARATGHLAVVVRLIDGLPIGQSAEAEEALAQMLARGWPRSAPLLETAFAAFGWNADPDQVKDRPAVAFLAARRNGLRFVEQVEDSDHPLNRAWTELSTPGFKRSRRARREEIRQLLTGIRNNFPELEHHLDPQRVGAWEKVLYAPKTNWVDTLVRRGSRSYIFLVIGFAVLRMLADFSGLGSRPATEPPPMFAFQEQAMNAASHRWFGADTDFAGLRKLAPLVARLAEHNAGGTSDPEAADKAMRSAIFLALALSVEHIDAERLRAVQTVRSLALDAAADAGPGACMDFLKRGQMDDKVVLTQPVADAAAAHVRTIAATGLFDRNPEVKAMQAAIPGPVVRAVMDTTGLAPSVVTAAFQRHGSDAAQCAVLRALMAEALKLPGRAGEAILRTL